MAANDFLKNEFEQVNLLVAFNQPLQRLTELMQLIGPKMTQRGQSEVHERQTSARGDGRDFRPELDRCFAHSRNGSPGQFRELCRAHAFVRAEKHGIHERGSVERFASGGLDHSGE